MIPTYSKDKFESAEFFICIPTWMEGYPQPEDSYKNVVFEERERCQECSSGKRQIQPFRMSKEPNWKSRRFLLLNWEYEYVFTTIETWNSIFKPIGVGYIEVLSESGNQLENVVQLKIPAENINFEVENASTYSKCNTCGLTKYTNAFTEIFPSLNYQGKSQIFYPSTLFGVGNECYRLAVVTRELQEKLVNRSDDLFFYPI